MRNYKNIKAWQVADRLVTEVYVITREYPKDERYGLISQLRRSAISTATNICEGAGRQHKKDYLNFLYIARGSLMETEYLILLSFRFEYLSDKKYHDIEEIINETQSKLYGLIRSVETEL